MGSEEPLGVLRGCFCAWEPLRASRSSRALLGIPMGSWVMMLYRHLKVLLAWDASAESEGELRIERTLISQQTDRKKERERDHEELLGAPRSPSEPVGAPGQPLGAHRST